MHNDVVKLRAGAVQREANPTERHCLNLDSSHAARQLQPHVMWARLEHQPRCHEVKGGEPIAGLGMHGTFCRVLLQGVGFMLAVSEVADPLTDESGGNHLP